MFQLPPKRHLAANCPNEAIFCSECRVDYKGNSAVQRTPVVIHVCGIVEGTPVKSVA